MRRGKCFFGHIENKPTNPEKQTVVMVVKSFFKDSLGIDNEVVEIEEMNIDQTEDLIDKITANLKNLIDLGLDEIDEDGGKNNYIYRDQDNRSESFCSQTNAFIKRQKSGCKMGCRSSFA